MNTVSDAPQPDHSLVTPGTGPLVAEVIVIGGGNAALCAAITAAEAGATVVLLERAPRTYRGGNSRHTRNFRCSHDESLGVLSGRYDLEEFYEDLLRVTKGNTDEALAKQVIRNAPESYLWMTRQGVIFQPSLSGTLSLSRTNAFFLGGVRHWSMRITSVAKILVLKFSITPLCSMHILKTDSAMVWWRKLTVSKNICGHHPL